MAAKKILVADDSLTIQKVIRLALSNEGYEIQAVSDGNDALEQISTWRPNVVLVDVSLPSRSAFELKRAINEHADLAHVKFVLMSSAFESVDENQVSEVRFSGRLTKPFDPAHLRQILTQALGEESPEPIAAAPEPPALPLTPPPPIRGKQPSTPIMPPPFVEQDESVTPPMSDFTATNILPSQSPKSDGGTETDIRKLTESTIKMSGLDEYEWSIQEPSLKPLPNLLDSDGSTFSPENANPVFPPGFDYTPPPLPEDTDNEIELAPAPPRPSPPALEREEPTLRMTAPKPIAQGASMPSEEEMDRIIKQHVEKAIEKFARELLPNVAERVIKQEIHRLLSEQP